MQPVLAEDLRLGCRSETVVAGSGSACFQEPKIIFVCVLVSYDASAPLSLQALTPLPRLKGLNSRLETQHSCHVFNDACFAC